MELRHLRAFVAVADELHFRRAAERLHVAQSPLSQLIQRLEAELGVVLFHRSRRRVELTDAGHAALAPARAALAFADRAAEQARAAAEGRAGVLRLGFVGSAAELLPDVLRALGADAPAVEVRLREATAAQQLAALRHGGLDAGIMAAPRAAAGLTVHRIDRPPLLAALPAGHRLARRSTVDVGALQGEPFVLFPRGEGQELHDAVMAACARGGFVPDVVQEAMAMSTVAALVGGGAGVSIVPASAAAYHADAVAFRPLRPPVTVPRAVVTPDPPSAVAARLVGHVAAGQPAGTGAVRAAVASTSPAP
jgi:DNA-binding transcriptional LysR family regulator